VLSDVSHRYLDHAQHQMHPWCDCTMPQFLVLSRTAPFVQARAARLCCCRLTAIVTRILDTAMPTTSTKDRKNVPKRTAVLRQPGVSVTVRSVLTALARDPSTAVTSVGSCWRKGESSQPYFICCLRLEEKRVSADFAATIIVMLA